MPVINKCVQQPRHPAPPATSYKRRNLAEYVEKYEGGPKQGGEVWLHKKTTTIGGSEMGTVVGANPYQNIKKLIETKLGMHGYTGNTFTRWGNMFEPVIQTYIEYDKNIEIIGTDIWILGESGRQSYSPDGLATMMVNYEMTMVEKQPDGTQISRTVVSPEEKIVLFEFKCPFNRGPGVEPPPQYIPQVKTGLNTIPIAEIGLFADAVFRRCMWGSLEWNNSEFTPTLNSKKSYGKFPLAMGFVGFYIDVAAAEDPKHAQTLRALLGHYDHAGALDYMDLGEANDDAFELTMSAYDGGLLKLWYSGVVYRGGANGVDSNHTNSLNSNLADFTAYCDCKYKMFAVLPWKLFRIDYHFIDKEEGFVASNMKKINEILDVVEACRVNPSRTASIIHSYTNPGGYDDE